MIQEYKLSILLALLFIAMVFFFFMITMRSLGNINHSLDRLADIIKKEAKLTHKQQIKNLKSEKQKEATSADRHRRQKALLNVPLMDLRPKPPSKEEDKD